MWSITSHFPVIKIIHVRIFAVLSTNKGKAYQTESLFCQQMAAQSITGRVGSERRNLRSDHPWNLLKWIKLSENSTLELFAFYLDPQTNLTNDDWFYEYLSCLVGENLFPTLVRGFLLKYRWSALIPSKYLWMFWNLFRSKSFIHYVFWQQLYVFKPT